MALLRDYQERIFNQVVSGADKDNIYTFLIQQPTGSGKTILGLALAKYFYETRGWRTNWLVMRRKLLSQVLELQKAHFPGEAEKGYVTPVSMFDKRPPSAHIVIPDEAHHDACASAVLHHARVSPKIIIGLSATPLRSDKLRLAFQCTITDAGIHRLIGAGWLSQFNHWNIPKYTAETAAAFYLADRERWGKTAVFFRSIHECYRFKQLLLLEGVRCHVVSSRMPEAEREDRLSDFEDGPVDVVANVFILSEGYDFAALKTVFLRDSSRLPTIQLAGRVLRPHPSKGGGANIVQSINTHWPFTRTASSQNTLLWKEDRWLTLLGKNELIQQAYDDFSEAIPLSTFEPLPRLLLDAQGKRGSRVWRRSRNQWRRR